MYLIINVMSKNTLTKTEIKDIIKTELEKRVEREVLNVLKTKKSEQQVKELVLKTMISFYKLLYMRSSFWSKDV